MPKDMLVKLVSTIKEETIKEYEEKMEEYKAKFNFVKEFAKKSGVHIKECSFPNCNATRIYDRYQLQDFTFDFIISCKECNKFYCKKHLANELYCVDCKGNFIYCAQENCDKIWKEKSEEQKTCIFCENIYCKEHIKDYSGDCYSEDYLCDNCL